MANQECYPCARNHKICQPNCVLRMHFPAGKEADWNLIEHLFGYDRIKEKLERRALHQRRKIIKSLTWEALSWDEDPVGGPRQKYRVAIRQRRMLVEQLVEYQREARAAAPVEAPPAAPHQGGPVAPIENGWNRSRSPTMVGKRWLQKIGVGVRSSAWVTLQIAGFCWFERSDYFF